ncbi:hypothetical protein HAX54_038326, partial [Datura stramonium]|nr:hypothetical protein [Datura stramonium]
MDASSDNPSKDDVPLADTIPLSTQGGISIFPPSSETPKIVDPTATPDTEGVGPDTGLRDIDISDPNLEIEQTMDDTSGVKDKRMMMMIMFLL